MQNKKVEIVYVIPKFYPYKGGAERNILALATRMAEAGHDVTVLTGDYGHRGEKLSKYEEYNGLKIKRFKAFIPDPFYLTFIPGLFFTLLKINPQVIHTSGIGFIWVEFCLGTKKFFDKVLQIFRHDRQDTTFVNTPHGPFMAFEEGKSESKIREFARKIYAKVLKIIIPNIYDKAIAVVERQKKWLKNLYKFEDKNIWVVPNGIDKAYLVKEMPTFKKEDKIVITYLNRMSWYKGIHTVLEALFKINKDKNFMRRKIPKFEFWIMGRPTPYTEKLTKMIDRFELGNQTKFIYNPTDEERDRIYFEESQINILASKWEATGIVLIEAMAKGNAIITTYQNDAHDLVVDEGKNGYVINFGDSETLSERLKKLISNYKLRQSMILAGREKVKDFTWESIFPKYEKHILEEIDD